VGELAGEISFGAREGGAGTRVVVVVPDVAGAPR